MYIKKKNKAQTIKSVGNTQQYYYINYKDMHIQKLCIDRPHVKPLT